jgi:hypothetical protein
MCHSWALRLSCGKCTIIFVRVTNAVSSVLGNRSNPNVHGIQREKTGFNAMRLMRLCSPLFSAFWRALALPLSLCLCFDDFFRFAEVANPFTSLAMSYEKRVVRSRHLFPTTLHLFQFISNMTINMSRKHIYLHE